MTPEELELHAIYANIDTTLAEFELVIDNLLVVERLKNSVIEYGTNDTIHHFIHTSGLEHYGSFTDLQDTASVISGLEGIVDKIGKAIAGFFKKIGELLASLWDKIRYIFTGKTKAMDNFEKEIAKADKLLGKTDISDEELQKIMKKTMVDSGKALRNLDKILADMDKEMTTSLGEFEKDISDIVSKETNKGSNSVWEKWDKHLSQKSDKLQKAATADQSKTTIEYELKDNHGKRVTKTAEVILKRSKSTGQNAVDRAKDITSKATVVNAENAADIKKMTTAYVKADTALSKLALTAVDTDAKRLKTMSTSLAHATKQ